MHQQEQRYFHSWRDNFHSCEKKFHWSSSIFKHNNCRYLCSKRLGRWQVTCIVWKHQLLFYGHVVRLLVEDSAYWIPFVRIQVVRLWWESACMLHGCIRWRPNLKDMGLWWDFLQMVPLIWYCFVKVCDAGSCRGVAYMFHDCVSWRPIWGIWAWWAWSQPEQ